MKTTSQLEEKIKKNPKLIRLVWLKTIKSSKAELMYIIYLQGHLFRLPFDEFPW